MVDNGSRWFIIYPIKNEIRTQFFTHGNDTTNYVWNEYYNCFKKNEFAFKTLEEAKEGLIKKKKQLYIHNVNQMLISKKELEDAFNGNIKIFGNID